MHETKNTSLLKQLSVPDTADLIHALSKRAAYPFPLPEEIWIEFRQTHASAVLLVAEHVYKLKKPKNFGFFDYSTPELRRHFCTREVIVNRRYAASVYLGVAPVLLFPDGSARFGPIFQPGSVPQPGDVLEGGSVVDFAVVMQRLPDDAMLEQHIQAGTATPELLSAIARYIAAFHRASETNERIAGFGSLDVVRGNWEENFAQMQPYIGRTITASDYEKIVTYIRGFMRQRAALFDSRVREGHIRDCHGDLRLQHIYILDDTNGPRFAILDGIEFNERFRYSDVASEIAFLAMELDAAGRPDLSRAFIESYVEETEDDALREVIPFYTCYRACVRGKVTSFQLDEVEVPERQRDLARQEASSLFALAAHYASGPAKPLLILVGGLMGTGKSTLAEALHVEMGAALFSSDTTRKQLAHLDPAAPQASAFTEGVYAPEWTARTYEALLSKAGRALSAGRSVVLDASFIRRADRLAAARLAGVHHARVIFLECVCPRAVSLERLARRWQQRVEGEAGQTASLASDGRPELYDAQATIADAFDPGVEPAIEHIVAKTMMPLYQSRELMLAALHVPRLACWL